MTACLVLYIPMLHSSLGQCLIKQNRVVPINYRIILAVDQKNRRTIRRNMFLY